MNVNEKLKKLENSGEWLPPGEMEGTLLPEEFSFPPLPDPVESERFLRQMEVHAQAVKGYYMNLRMAVELALNVRRENGGTNRLYVHASRWGIRISERTPRLGRLEGRMDVENPDFVKRGW